MMSNPFNKFKGLQLSQKGILLVCVPLAFGLIFVTVLILLELQAESAALQESRRKDTLLQIVQTQLHFDQTAKCMTLFFITKKDVWRDRLLKCLKEIPEEITTLKKAVAYSPKLLETANELENEAQRMSGLMSSFQSALSAEGGSAITTHAWEWRRDFLQVTGQFESLINEMLGEVERSKKNAPIGLWASRATLVRILIVGVALNILITLALALFYSQNITRRIAIIVDNANRMAAGEPLNPEQGGPDEISQLDRVFHQVTNSLLEASRKERAVFDNAIDVICRVNKSGMFADVNKAAENLWQYKSNELIGKKLVDVISDNDKESVSKTLVQLKTTSQLQPQEWQVLSKDGTALDMLWTIHWSESESSYFCVAHDVSERKRIEQLKRDFINMVSHDLRTPMLSFQIFLDLLVAGKAGELTPKTLEMAQKLRPAMRTLTNLINDLLDLEKMEAGKLTLRITQVPFDELVKEAEDTLRSIANTQQVELMHTGDPEIEIKADRDRLSQVVINLLANAIKVSPPKSCINLSYALKEAGLEVRVKDDGPGIPVEFQEKIFEKFGQIEGSKRAGQTGAGLGLTICKQIISLHGGQIGVDSNGHTGTQFWFTIPIENVTENRTSG